MNKKVFNKNRKEEVLVSSGSCFHNLGEGTKYVTKFSPGFFTS